MFMGVSIPRHVRVSLEVTIFSLTFVSILSHSPSAIPVIISNPTVAKAQEAAVKFNVREFTDDAMKVRTGN